MLICPFRYSADEFCSVSHINVMSYEELKEQLGVDPDCTYHQLFSPSPKKPAPLNGKKVLSFVSDSWYLSSPSNEIDNEHHSPNQADHSPELNSDNGEYLSASTSPYIPPGAPLNESLSGFPQPLFDDDDEEGDVSDLSMNPLYHEIPPVDKDMLPRTTAVASSTPKISLPSVSITHSRSRGEMDHEATGSNYHSTTDLPTPYDNYDLLNRGPENTTPVDPSVINPQSLAVKQHLKLSSCSPKYSLHPKNRVPLKPVNNTDNQLVQYGPVDSKENVCVKGRARKYIKHRTAETKKPTSS